MQNRSLASLLPCVLLIGASAAYAQQADEAQRQTERQVANGPPGSPSGPRELRVTTSVLPDNPDSARHKEQAKRMAGADPVLNSAWNFFCTPTKYNTPGPQMQATKVFDNLYAIPTSTEQETTIWAITTSQGIVLIDSGWPGKTEEILANMRTLGLNPADVKYILLGHGHADHYGSAAYFQQHYGTRVGSTAKDWDLMYPEGKPATNAAYPDLMVPKRDLVVKEGPFTLGDEKIQIVEIPGHTPGSIAFIFKVKDHGKTHTAGLFGGTIQDQPRISIPELKQYLGSIAHYQTVAKQMKVDVEIQNHAIFDDTAGRLEKMKTLKAGEPNPFLMANEKYLNLWGLVSECIQSEIARRPPGAR